MIVLVIMIANIAAVLVMDMIQVVVVKLLLLI